MGFSELLLYPFKKHFKAPILVTPVSTIKLPPTGVTVTLVFLSFFVIVGGFIYCFVNGIPMVGYRRDQHGNPVPSWIDPNGLSSQFLAEGMVASMIFSLGALSIMCAFYVMNKSKKEKEGEFDKYLRGFGYTAPLWTFLAFQLFHIKIPNYFPYFSIDR